MATTVNTYAELDPRSRGLAVGTFLKNYYETTVTEAYGQVDPQPRNKTDTRIWRRYLDFAAVISPLGEAVSGPGKKVRYQDVQATMELYGDSAEFSRKIKDLHEDPIGKIINKQLSEQAKLSIELLRINGLKAGTNVFYANGVASRSLVNSPPTRGDFRRILRSFRRANAKKFTEIIVATDKVSTQPVEAAYFVLGHTDLASDLRNISGFLPVAQYSQSNKARPGEIGTIEDFRIILTNNFAPWEAAGVAGTTYLSGGAAVSAPTASDVYPLIFLGTDAYGIVPLEGSSVEMSFVNAGVGTKDDIHGLKGVAGWSSWQAFARLNESWMGRLECACTASPS